MISILCPTRNRPKELARMIKSACDTASSLSHIEFRFRVDDDDTRKYEYYQEACPKSFHVLRGDRHKIMCHYWNELIPHATGNIFMCGNDDIEFKTPGWDAMIEAEFAKYPDQILLCGGDDGFTHGKAIPHPFVSRKWCEIQGFFSAPYFESDYGTDTWNEDIARMIGRRVYLPELLIYHHHPCFGTGPKDRTYKERIVRGYEQNPGKIYREKFSERVQIAGRLKAAMMVAA